MRTSMLDFNFVAGGVKDWKAESRVIVRDGDFHDDDKTSDHRPVELTISMGDGTLETWIEFWDRLNEVDVRD